jgi:DHA1 family tetracycline resistance protein-like MFS transporter
MFIIFLVTFIGLMGFGIILPLLPFYAERLGAGPEIITLTMAVFSLGQFFAAPFWGRVSDSIGRKKVIIISLFGSAISYVLLAFADTLTLVILSRAFAGLMAGNISIAFAYVTDITDEKNRSAGLGKVSAALGLGFMTGPAIGGFLAGSDVENANYVLTAMAGASLNVVALVGAIFFLKESLEPSKRKSLQGLFKIFEAKTFYPKKLILPLVACGLFFYCSMSTMEAIFPLWANAIFNYGPSHIGGVFFMLGLVAVIIQGGLIGPLTKLLGEKRLIQIAALSLMTGLVLIGNSSSEFILWPGLFFYGAGAAMFNPSLSSLVSKSAKDNERGMYLGQYQAACAMGRILGPTFSGVLYSTFQPSAPFFAGVVIALPVILLIANFTLRKSEGVIE